MRRPFAWSCWRRLVSRVTSTDVPSSRLPVDRFWLVDETESDDWLAGSSDVVDRWSAPTADALHRILVLHGAGTRSADAFEPFALLAKHHEIEPKSSVTTALLLLTDHRWQSGGSHLVRRIAESGILTEEHLDLLAQTFLAAADAVYWKVPDDWFAGGPLIELPAPWVGAEEDEEYEGAGPEEEDEADGPAVARRTVFPPLRRWAAAREVNREPAAWGAMLNRAQELGGRDGAAVMAGLLDGIDVLPADAQGSLAKQGTTWPHHSVRRLAYEHIATHDGVDAVLGLALNDPNAKVRAWAATLAEPSPGALPVAERALFGAVEGPDECDQSTLF